MAKNNKTQFKLISIEDASILRKFTELFFLMSILPLTIITLFYLQVAFHGEIRFSKSRIEMALMLVVFGIVVGYGAMRSVIKKLIELTIANRKALENVLSPDKIKELSEEKNEIAVLARSFTVITERLEDNVRSLELAKRTLHQVMSKVGQGMTSMQNIDTFLQLILETVTDALRAKTGGLLLCDDQNKKLVVKSVYGIDEQNYIGMTVPLRSDSVFQPVFTGRSSVVLSDSQVNFFISDKLQPVFSLPLLCAPLVYQDRSMGIITISGQPGGKFEDDEIKLLYNLACQTAVAIENSKLNKDMEATYFETISALALAVDAKDKYSRGHLDRVARYCMIIGKKLGLDKEELNTLRDAARLHDLGKIGIPDEVLQKMTPLNEQEWILMRKHPEIGESIIRPIRSLHHLCDLIRHHHEKIDGSGYPDSIKGDKITPLVRILTIADIYDALTTNRPYRDRMSRETAFKELRKMQDKIDQDIVEAFIEALYEEEEREFQKPTSHQT